ncbi:MAG: hypothetical protein V4623_03130, partial [Pseudomonadota bacterium]
MHNRSTPLEAENSLDTNINVFTQRLLSPLPQVGEGAPAGAGEGKHNNRDTTTERAKPAAKISHGTPQ